MKTMRNSSMTEERQYAERLLKSKNPLARALGGARKERIESGEGFMTREQILEQVRKTRAGKS